MAITKEQALTENMFHEDHEPGAKQIVRWRRNGRTQTWVTRPTEFRVPVKWGFRNCSQITEVTPGVHAASTCEDR
jgi:hypothetical protein